MKIIQIMTPDPACCHPETSLQQVAQMMVDYDCGEIPVVERGAKVPVGVVTDRDIVCRALAQGLNPLEMSAADCMSSPCITVTQEMTVDRCCTLMEEHQLRRIVVVDDKGEICGIVAQADLAQVHSPKQVGEVVREVSQPRAA
ncbi:MAG TPA: CBS domain-containing protein [Terriglobales bacterium]|nr:CBS domain-containing protein [Terriglobales bacterium]